MIPRPIFAVLLMGAVPASATFALQPPAENIIRLRARTFAPPAGIDSATLRLAERRGREPLHVLVQFRASMTGALRDSMTAELGVRWLRPLTDRLFWAVVGRDPVILRSVAARVRWVGSLRPTDKFAPEAEWPLMRPTIPDSGNWTMAVVHFFSDVDTAAQRTQLVRRGAKRLERVGMLNAWGVGLRPDSLLPLAQEEGVMFIEPAPGAPSFDNNFVRSTSGVNADAVLAGSAYALSGTGVDLGYWDGTIPSAHSDFGTRISALDPAAIGRNAAHAENGTANDLYDLGESIYLDVDDSQDVSAVDLRFAAGMFSTPLAGDLGKKLVLFQPREMYFDRNVNGAYTDGEPIYRDVNGDGAVTIGTDMLLSSAAAADGDPLSAFLQDAHAHSTMVVGSMLGSGLRSISEGATSTLQWMGVAPSATARAHIVCDALPCWDTLWLDDVVKEFRTALVAGSFVHAHPWGATRSYCHLYSCYTSMSQIFDGYASGRDPNGVPFTFSRDVLAVTSAGNLGYPERHGENVVVNGRFDPGESIYRDMDGDGLVSGPDERISGSDLPEGTALADFNLDEVHTFAPDDSTFVDGQGIYRDLNRTTRVDVGDERLTTVGALPPGIVAPGDADAAAASRLRPFALWFTVRGGNSAKNTLQVGSISSIATGLHAWSGRGPTLDGRLKPDLVSAGASSGAAGIKTPSPRNRYGDAAGTSMSVGTAAGSAALLTEWYKSTCVAAGPTAASLKALLIHAAEDVALPSFNAHPGPDFSSGYGRLRVKEAVDLVPHHRLGTVSSTAPATPIQITIARTQPLKVTLVWSDVTWSLVDAPTSHGILQNDLDMVLVGPDGRQYTPWRSEAGNPWAAATRGVFTSAAIIEEAARDRRNTVEQVLVDDAQPGVWKIYVSASQLNFGPQAFTLVSEAFAPADSPCLTTPSADVWVRDNDGDTGAVPSSGLMWLGPDLWNRYAADGLTDHQNPEHGQANFLYVNVRNRSAVAVKSTTVELWIADASLGLNWPAHYTLVGTMTVPNLGPNEVRQVGPLEWNPPAPGVSGHFCMYMRLRSAQDGIAIVEGASITTNASSSNNIAYRNLHIIDLNSERSISFLVRNTTGDTANVQVVVRVPQALLEEGQVRVALDPALARRAIRPGADLEGLTLDRTVPRTLTPRGTFTPDRYRLSRPEVLLPEFRLPPGHAERLTITFSSTRTTQSVNNVDVMQLIGGRITGGIRYVVRTGFPP